MCIKTLDHIKVISELINISCTSYCDNTKLPLIIYCEYIASPNSLLVTFHINMEIINAIPNIKY